MPGIDLDVLEEMVLKNCEDIKTLTKKAEETDKQFEETDKKYSSKSDNEELRKKLDKQSKDYDSEKSRRDIQFIELRSSIEKKADAVTVGNQYEDITKKLNAKADIDVSDAPSKKISDINDKHGLNTCIFLCAVLLFNILAIWLIIYRPVFSGSTEIKELPWLYIMPLFTCLLCNIAGTIIWAYHFAHAVDCYIWQVVMEVLLLMFNMVVMWLFAFHPIELSDAVIALAVFLMLANIMSLIMKILHFIYEHTSKYFNMDAACITLCVFGTIFVIVIWMIFVFWIRL